MFESQVAPHLVLLQVILNKYSFHLVFILWGLIPGHLLTALLVYLAQCIIIVINIAVNQLSTVQFNRMGIVNTINIRLRQKKKKGHCLSFDVTTLYHVLSYQRFELAVVITIRFNY